MRLVYPDDPILRRYCHQGAVLPRDTISEMFDLMYSLSGLGLAAPQVGIDARIFVTCWGQIFIDPVVLVKGNPRLGMEGCLSLPGVWKEVLRYPMVDVGGYQYEGWRANVIQHEFDHLNGRVIDA
jgi:peptide deformylase